jgi:hypothetical protein
VHLQDYRIYQNLEGDIEPDLADSSRRGPRPPVPGLGPRWRAG